MSDIKKVIESLQIDIGKFLLRVKDLAPRIDEVISEGQEKMLLVEDLVAMEEVDKEILPELNKILQQYEINTEYAYARRASADERLLETTVHLNMLLGTLQQLAAYDTVFDRLLNANEASDNEAI